MPGTIHDEIPGFDRDLRTSLRVPYTRAYILWLTTSPGFSFFLGFHVPLSPFVPVSSSNQNVLPVRAFSAFSSAGSSKIPGVHGASLDHRQLRADFTHGRAILRTLRRSYCTVS